MNVITKAAPRRAALTAPATPRTTSPQVKSEESNSLTWVPQGYESKVSIINTEPSAWSSPETAPSEGQVREYGSGYHVAGTIVGGKREAPPSDSVQVISGSSGFATPMVSGRVALLLELEPHLTPAQVKERITEEFGHIVS